MQKTGLGGERILCAMLRASGWGGTGRHQPIVVCSIMLTTPPPTFLAWPRCWRLFHRRTQWPRRPHAGRAQGRDHRVPSASGCWPNHSRNAEKANNSVSRRTLSARWAQEVSSGFVVPASAGSGAGPPKGGTPKKAVWRGLERMRSGRALSRMKRL